MTRYLLDTNTCVEFLRRGSSSLVSGRLLAVGEVAVVLCPVVVGELLFGAYQSRDMAKNLAEVRAFLARFAVLPIGGAESEQYGLLRSDLAKRGLPIGPNDLWIAAVALANGLTLVTHNTAEFSRVAGLTLEDWQVP